MTRPKNKSFINIETILILSIAICIIFLNSYTTTKIAQLEQAGTEAMFIKEGLEFPESQELESEIIKYRPDGCKMIEMYNDEFELMFAIQFDQGYHEHDTDITQYSEMIEILSSNKEGQTSINHDDYEEEVYFQWVTNDVGEDRLVIVYSTKDNVENIWVFSLVCYLVLILVFALLIRLHLKEYNAKINHYKQISSNAIDEVNRKH